MSGIPEDSLLEHRRQHRTDGGPLLTKEGKVQQFGSSLYLCIPTPIPDILNIEKGDDLSVHIFEDSYVVTTRKTPSSNGEHP